jgi:predicted P-loop ATPase
MSASIHNLTESRMLRAALEYARMGWHVFPLHEPLTEGAACSCKRGAQCGSAGKHPRTSRGHLQATTDERQIRQWWDRHPSANIGVSTGASSLVVVDVDPRNGGDDSLARLETEHDELRTVTGLTGGGGLHLVFERPADAEHLRSAPLAQGVDIKADGGYFVAPPSRHLSGRSYQWDAGARPDDELPAPLPAWVRTKLEFHATDAARSTGRVTDGLLGAAFAEADMLGRGAGPGRAAVICPWEAEHTGGTRFDSSSVVFSPSNGHEIGWFHCSHEHCRSRALSDVLAALPQHALVSARAKLGLDQDYRIAQPVPSASSDGVGDEAWRNMLAFDTKGQLRTNAGNATLILTHDPDWAGRLAYNEFADSVVWRQAPPELEGFKGAVQGAALQEADFTDVQHWFLRIRGANFSRAVIEEAIVRAAKNRRFNPLTRYLDDVHWDGTPRLDTWLVEHCGAAATPYTSTVGRLWMIGAVARAFKPGCQVDHMLVLEGAQGIGKSHVTRTLGGEFHLGAAPDLRQKDAALILQGHWIVECGELAQLHRAGAQRTKDWLTQTVDTYRAPYERAVQRRPRGCVFVGTTNETTYLDDPTGGRRFWPVTLLYVRRAALAEARDQLWAEAVAAFKSGEQWWLSDSEMSRVVAEEQAKRQEIDPWQDIVNFWLDERASEPSISVSEILSDCLNMHRDRWDRSHQMRVAEILKAGGWKQRQIRVSGGKARRYFREESGA